MTSVSPVVLSFLTSEVSHLLSKNKDAVSLRYLTKLRVAML